MLFFFLGSVRACRLSLPSRPTRFTFSFCFYEVLIVLTDGFGNRIHLFKNVFINRIPNGAPGGGMSGSNNVPPGYWDESRMIIEPPKELEKIKRNKPEVTEVADMLHNTRPPCEYNKNENETIIFPLIFPIESIYYYSITSHVDILCHGQRP